MYAHYLIYIIISIITAAQNICTYSLILFLTTYYKLNMSLRSNRLMREQLLTKKLVDIISLAETRTRNGAKTYFR